MNSSETDTCPRVKTQVVKRMYGTCLVNIILRLTSNSPSSNWKDVMKELRNRLIIQQEI